MTWERLLIMAAAAAALCGCTGAMQPLAVALAGAGTSTAIGHGLNGTAYRTFTQPIAEVKLAALETFALMGIRVDGLEPIETGEVILGSALRRTVEVELEPISERATRMRVVARNGGLFYDASTATEIVLQTEKALGVHEFTNSSVGTGVARRR